MVGINDFAKKTTIYAEDQKSAVIEEKKFGDIVIQKRRYTTNRAELTDSQGLTPAICNWSIMSTLRTPDITVLLIINRI